MALVRYVGPHIDGVQIPWGLGAIDVPHGEPVEVPDDLATSLLEQETNWQPVKRAARKKEADR